MGDKSWKQFERRAASFFGGKRNPLSGSMSGHTGGDVRHEKLYVECKQRKEHAVINLWDDAKTKADKENKTPVVCLSVKGRKGFWVMVHSNDLEKVAQCTGNKQ